MRGVLKIIYFIKHLEDMLLSMIFTNEEIGHLNDAIKSMQYCTFYYADQLISRNI